MSDDSKPYFTSNQSESISDEFPDLQSLDVEVQMSKIAGEDVGYRRYDGTELGSHLECPECGTRVSVGWTVGDYVEDKETDFEDTVSCHGEIFEGKSCVVFFEIDGTASYI